MSSPLYSAIKDFSPADLEQLAVASLQYHRERDKNFAKYASTINEHISDIAAAAADGSCAGAGAGAAGSLRRGKSSAPSGSSASDVDFVKELVRSIGRKGWCTST